MELAGDIQRELIGLEIEAAFLAEEIARELEDLSSAAGAALAVDADHAEPSGPTNAADERPLGRRYAPAT